MLYVKHDNDQAQLLDAYNQHGRLYDYKLSSDLPALVFFVACIPDPLDDHSYMLVFAIATIHYFITY